MRFLIALILVCELLLWALTGITAYALLAVSTTGTLYLVCHDRAGGRG